jgi:hypothetical protein
LHNFYRGESSPKIWATFCFLKNLPKADDQLIGENSPNLVALLAFRILLPKLLTRLTSRAKLYDKT